MQETAAHLTDRVLPDVPVRQWVLTLPFRLRFLVAFDRELLRDVRRVFVRAVLASMRRRAKATLGIPAGTSGAVAATQRFGAGLRLNVHVHALVLDGVYEPARDDRATPRFHALPPPSRHDVERVLAKVRPGIERLLARRTDDHHDRDAVLPGLLSDAVAARHAAPEGRLPGFTEPLVLREPLCVAADGYSLHAATALPAHQRPRLERLVRYILRPPIAERRLSFAPDGRIAVELPRPFHDGTRRLLFEPLAFLARLAALVPPPRAHLVTYHGVLAPSAALRSRIVPDATPKASPGVADDATCPTAIDEPSPDQKKRRLSWAELLHRAFEIDVLVCPACQGTRRVLAVITKPDVIRRILEHLGLPAKPPDVSAPADRAPPDTEPLFCPDEEPHRPAPAG